MSSETKDFGSTLKDKNVYSKFFTAILKPTRRTPGHSLELARLVSDSGTKDAPLLGSGNRRRAILFVSYRKISAAIPLLNKVYNSIYSKSRYWIAHRASAVMEAVSGLLRYLIPFCSYAAP
jgi:hypothetical protein